MPLQCKKKLSIFHCTSRDDNIRVDSSRERNEPSTVSRKLLMILFADKRQIINFSLIHFMCDIRFKTNVQILNCDWILPELYSLNSFFHQSLTTLSVRSIWEVILCVSEVENKSNTTHQNQVLQSIVSIQNHCLSSRQSLQQTNKFALVRIQTSKIDDDDDVCDQVSEWEREKKKRRGGLQQYYIEMSNIMNEMMEKRV